MCTVVFFVHICKTGCNPFQMSDIIKPSSQKGEIYEHIKR